MLPAPRARFFATSISLCINQIYFICSYMGIGIHRHSIPCRRARCYCSGSIEGRLRAQSPEHETNVISRIAVDLGCQPICFALDAGDLGSENRALKCAFDIRLSHNISFHPAIRMNSSPPVVDQLAILSDPIRVRMLSVLESRELTVSELCDVVQLHDVAELGDRQLATFQDREHAHTNRIGEDRKLIDNGRRTIHPYSRMKGYIGGRARVNYASGTT